MKLILKIFVLSFFVILLSGCTNDTNRDYYPYSSLSNNNDVGYIRSSNSYENISIEKSIIQNDLEDKSLEEVSTINTSSIIENEIETEIEPAQKTCCKYCSKGKACGDSCISRSYTCHKAPGCACDL